MDPHAADIDTFFWGALIFLALFVSCFLLWKAIEGRGNPTTLGVATTADPKAPRDPEIAWDPTDLFGEPWRGQEHLEGMNQREQEEYLLHHGPKQVRKAIKERRQAREQTQKQGNSS